MARGYESGGRSVTGKSTRNSGARGNAASTSNSGENSSLDGLNRKARGGRRRGKGRARERERESRRIMVGA